MSERAIPFLHLWLEQNDLLDGRVVDDAEIEGFAESLFAEAAAIGIPDEEIRTSSEELHLTLMLRRHPAPASKQ